MAGETTKSTRLTATQAGTKTDARKARAREVTALDVEAIAATELETADVTIFDIEIPTHAIVTEVAIYNDDLDSNCAPALAIDVGFVAGAAFTSTTSGTDTRHDEDDMLDADALVDGATDAQAATTKWTPLAFDATTFGPDDCNKAIWEVLGYDEDPRTTVRVAVTMATAAATAAAGDLGLKVKYLVD